VFGLPFDSGHVLALRVFPQNDFAPYRTIWHRDPGGRSAIYADAPRLDIACPRYYGAACHRTARARIAVEWTGAASLRVRMDAPPLDWSVSAIDTPLLRALNALSQRLPAWTWRPPSLLRARELLAGRVLGLGDLRLSGTMPSGHRGVFMPQRMYLIEDSAAVLEGKDLGRPTRMTPNPRIGEVPLAGSRRPRRRPGRVGHSRPRGVRADAGRDGNRPMSLTLASAAAPRCREARCARGPARAAPWSS
jgi:hypothetical protein